MRFEIPDSLSVQTLLYPHLNSQAAATCKYARSSNDDVQAMSETNFQNAFCH